MFHSFSRLTFGPAEWDAFQSPIELEARWESMPGFCGTAMVRVVPPLGLSGLVATPHPPSITSMGSGPIGSLQSALRGHLGAGVGDTRPGKHRKTNWKNAIFHG
jgi:hypothetical protein